MPRTTSTRRNNSLPPSNAGIGSRFITPRLTLKRIAKLIIVSTIVGIPYGFVASIVSSIVAAIPTGPDRSSADSFPESA